MSVHIGTGSLKKPHYIDTFMIKQGLNDQPM